MTSPDYTKICKIHASLNTTKHEYMRSRVASNAAFAHHHQTNLANGYLLHFAMLAIDSSVHKVGIDMLPFAMLAIDVTNP